MAYFNWKDKFYCFSISDCKWVLHVDNSEDNKLGIEFKNSNFQNSNILPSHQKDYIIAYICNPFKVKSQIVKMYKLIYIKNSNLYCYDQSLSFNKNDANLKKKINRVLKGYDMVLDLGLYHIINLRKPLAIARVTIVTKDNFAAVTTGKRQYSKRCYVACSSKAVSTDIASPSEFSNYRPHLLMQVSGSFSSKVTISEVANGFNSLGSLSEDVLGAVCEALFTNISFRMDFETRVPSQVYSVNSV